MELHACNDTDKICELVYVNGSAPLPQDEVIDAIVGFQESLDMPQCALDRVRQSPSTHMNKTDRAVNWFV